MSEIFESVIHEHLNKKAHAKATEKIVETIDSKGYFLLGSTSEFKEQLKSHLNSFGRLLSTSQIDVN